VAQDLSHEEKGCTTHHRETGKRMPEIMNAKAFKARFVLRRTFAIYVKF
jgi:hypothetical protein